MGSSGMLWVYESERVRAEKLLTVPPAEYGRSRVLREPMDALSSVVMSAGDIGPSKESMMELMTAGFAGFALTRLGECLFERGRSWCSDPCCDLGLRASHCWRSDWGRRVAVMAGEATERIK